jgi:hypothetical protein
MSGEEACCNAGRQRIYILRMEKTNVRRNGALGCKKGQAAVLLSEGGLPADAC